jgi:hypothetical protein
MGFEPALAVLVKGGVRVLTELSDKQRILISLNFRGTTGDGFRSQAVLGLFKKKPAFKGGQANLKGSGDQALLHPTCHCRHCSFS